jgi:uncharacterized protein YdbL (DUF1318 family)
MRGLFFVVSLVLLSAVPAFALSLDEAKQQGLVGEQPDGYLGARSQDDAVKSLVSEVNNKRKELYQQIAAKNNTPVGAVEALAGEKAIEKTDKGNYVQTKAGAWVKK